MSFLGIMPVLGTTCGFVGAPLWFSMYWGWGLGTPGAEGLSQLPATCPPSKVTSESCSPSGWSLEVGLPLASLLLLSAWCPPTSFPHLCFGVWPTILLTAF